MATMAVTCASSMRTTIVARSPAASASARHRVSKMSVRRLNAFQGLKPDCMISQRGVSQCTEVAFAAMRARCNASFGGLARGGAAASTCDVASEILLIVPLMCALTLVGVALGFVLLRVEAAVEESE